MQHPQLLKWYLVGLPWCGPVVKSLPCNAGDTGWIPDWGTRIPHDAEQPGLWNHNAATEPEPSGAPVP